MKDMTDLIIAYESGELSDQETVDFFQKLVDSGLAWTLQGSYGRMAHEMIREGLISDTRAQARPFTSPPIPQHRRTKKGKRDK